MYESPSATPLMQEAQFGSVSVASAPWTYTDVLLWTGGVVLIFAAAIAAVAIAATAVV